MKQVIKKQGISLADIEQHYQISKGNYKIPSGESHLAYYRDKNPEYYKRLLENV